MTTYDALCEMIALRDKTKSMEERMPYEIAVSSLGAQWESEKEAGEGFVRCGYVLLSEKFGRYMEPYFGCPRGALGHKFFPEGTSGISEVISYIGAVTDGEDKG